MLRQGTKPPVSLSLATLAATSLWTALPVHAQEAAPEYIPFPDWPYFSEMVIVGNTIYLSGTLGIGPDLLVVPGGIGAETRQALENIRDSLAKVDATMDDVVKCTVFLVDMSDWMSMNEVYVTFFSEGRVPARSAVAVSGLSMHAKVEIECIAVRSPG